MAGQNTFQIMLLNGRRTLGNKNGNVFCPAIFFAFQMVCFDKTQTEQIRVTLFLWVLDLSYWLSRGIRFIRQKKLINSLTVFSIHFLAFSA